MELGKPLRRVVVEPVEPRKHASPASPKDPVARPCALPTTPTR
jgi:hypothetical protein